MRLFLKQNYSIFWPPYTSQRAARWISFEFFPRWTKTFQGGYENGFLRKMFFVKRTENINRHDRTESNKELRSNIKRYSTAHKLSISL